MKKKVEISYVEIVLTNGFHMRINPKTQRAYSWQDTNGGIWNYEEGPLEKLIEALEQRKQNASL